jgi:predicted DNA-binding ribbon-helix-helix protein
MESKLAKRSVVIGGRKTSVSLEDEFWDALRQLAKLQQVPLSCLVVQIKEGYSQYNLSSAIRVFLFRYHRTQSNPRSGYPMPGERGEGTLRY